MIDLPDRHESLLVVLTGMAAVAGSYVLTGWSPTFVVAPVDQQIVNLTPGAIVTFMIENVGEAGHLLHIGLAVATMIGVFGLVSLAGIRLAARIDIPLAGGLVAGAVAWLLAAVLTGEFLLAAGPAVAIAVFTTLGSRSSSRTQTRPERPGAADSAPAPAGPTRRRTLGTLVAAVGFAGSAALGGRLIHGNTRNTTGSSLGDVPGSTEAESRLAAASAASLDLASDDLPGLVSSTSGFYNVDIAEFDPEVSSGEWSLTFTGDVESERTIDFDELTDRPVENRLVTLRCVGEKINDKKIDTAVWTGTPIRPLLESVDPDGDCDCAMLRGEDGYYVQFPVDVLASGFLAWGMNGTELPTGHGHPVRVLIPGHWGETNVKWLHEIELLNTEEDGYWEERGWEGTGEVKTVAKLWDEGITHLDDSRVELAGHAYAGTRGIDRVEVSTDGGDTWADAELSEPLADEDVWRQWRYTFDPDGSHDVIVRATDGEGTLQIREESGPSPTGSSGWVQRTIDG
ncbi:MAG: molybdopterin-dependent oxidoreductase [Halovenus sp.]